MRRLREAMDARASANAPEPPSTLSRGDQWRRFARTGIFFSGIILVVIRILSIWRDFAGWRMSANDPSARDAYVTFIEVDVAGIVLIVFGAFALARLLLPRDH